MTLRHSAENPPTKGACCRHTKIHSTKKGHRRSAFRLYDPASKPPSVDGMARLPRPNGSLNSLVLEELASSSDWVDVCNHLHVESSGYLGNQISAAPWKTISSWRQGSCRTSRSPTSLKASSSSTSHLDSQLRQTRLSEQDDKLDTTCCLSQISLFHHLSLA